MKEKIGDCLYILFNDNNDIIAISEFEDRMSIYIHQFHRHFSENKCTVLKEFDDNRINKLLNKFSVANLQPLNDNIVLTELELTYYDLLFKELYDNAKNIVLNSIMLSDLLKLNDTEFIKLKDTIDTLYQKTLTYDEFLNNLKEEELFNKYIEKPLLSKSIIEDYNSQQYELSLKLYKEN